MRLALILVTAISTLAVPTAPAASSKPISAAEALRLAIAFEKTLGRTVRKDEKNSCILLPVRGRSRVVSHEVRMECHLLLRGGKDCDTVWVVRGKDGRWVARRPTTAYFVCLL